jgi:peptidoglycan hydrolase-like protein with peptidoglycan-binding domain
MSNTTLRLGKVDQGATPANKRAFLSNYHAVFPPALQNKLMFRDEADGVWQPFSEVAGTSVKELQQFLKDAGFMPKSSVDGIYGYATQAAVRLFQEYIRTVEGDASIGNPDGIAGSNTFKFVEKWKSEKTGKPEFVCKWAQFSSKAGSEEFNKWIGLLQKAKESYSATENPILKFSEKYDKPSDTLKVKDWKTSANDIHLIGIRRNQNASARKRENDDLFVLLINGMVFKFWGSTDPSQGMAGKRKDEPFLIEGQHEFKFGWHKVSDAKQAYRALKPANLGVLVFRDRDNDNSLTPADIAKGLDSRPNLSINIHWSGKGETNYSAGCQVIAGQSYSNHEGKVIDCSSFAASGYADLAKGKTRGAYNVFTDLLLSYAPEGVQTIVYTLARDESFLLAADIDEHILAGWEGSLKENGGVV